MAYFELTHTSEVATAWFVAWDTGDLMAMVFRDDASSEWRFTGRVRKIMDEKDPFESQDTKEGFSVTGERDDLLGHAISAVDDIVKKASELGKPVKAWRVDVNGSSDDFLRAWAKMPFVHTKVSAPGPVTVQ